MGRLGTHDGSSNCWCRTHNVTFRIIIIIRVISYACYTSIIILNSPRGVTFTSSFEFIIIIMRSIIIINHWMHTLSTIHCNPCHTHLLPVSCCYGAVYSIVEPLDVTRSAQQLLHTLAHNTKVRDSTKVPLRPVYY